MKEKIYGPKTKASMGMERYTKINATIPPKLYRAILVEQRDNETFSGVIQRLLNVGIERTNNEC